MHWISFSSAPEAGDTWLPAAGPGNPGLPYFPPGAWALPRHRAAPAEPGAAAPAPPESASPADDCHTIRQTPGHGSKARTPPSWLGWPPPQAAAP